MKLRYTDRAKNDVELALEWYEKQKRGLGFEFLDCIETALKEILPSPKSTSYVIPISVEMLSGDFLSLYSIQSRIMK